MRRVAPTAAVMVLIDHQVGTMNWIGSVDRATVEANVRALARAATELGMPVVLTSSQEDRDQGPSMSDLKRLLPTEFESRVRRDGVVNGWDDPAFADACRAPDRGQLIMAGVTTDVCLAPPAICAAEVGFEVFAVVDASGSPNAMTDEMAFRRMARYGVELTTTSALLSELANDWSGEGGRRVLRILGEEILSRGR